MDALIAQQLHQAEQNVARIAAQAAQEAAMAEVLPIRFADNIAAFSEYMPAVAAQFRDYQPTRSFEFFCGENGIPNLRWCDDGSVFYRTDPDQYCRDQIDSVLNESSLDRGGSQPNNHIQGSFNALHLTVVNQFLELNRDLATRLVPQQSQLTSAPLVMCFGVGLGYQLGYLYERCDVANLFLFEPDLDVFYASLYCFDWAPLLAFLQQHKKGLHLFLGQDEHTVINDVIQVIGRYGVYQVSSTIGFWHYPSPAISALRETVEQQFHLLTLGWGFFDDSLYALSHSCRNISARLPFLRHQAQVSPVNSQLPVFIVGNGPSLDAALPYLQQYQQQGLVIACGSSISALHRVGIKPDIYVAVERVQAMSDFLTVLNDPDYLKDILFLSVDVIHPQHQHIFERIGLCMKGDEMLTALFKARQPELLKQFRALRGLNPLVGNMGLTTALALGFRQIYLLGIDNGYRHISHHHSKESAYFDDAGQPIEVLTNSKNDNLRLPANFGGEVVSNNYFAQSAYVMGTVLAVFPDADCYNCADGAAIKGAKPLALTNMLIPPAKVDKKTLVDEIYGLYSPLPLDAQQLQDAMDCQGYNQLVDKLLAHWVVLPDSRAAWTIKIQEQYDELRALGPQHALHVKLIIGSVYHMYALMTRILYRFENEAELMTEMHGAYRIFEQFLLDSKEVYPRASDWLDTNTLNHVQAFRKGRSS